MKRPRFLFVLLALLFAFAASACGSTAEITVAGPGVGAVGGEPLPAVAGDSADVLALLADAPEFVSGNFSMSMGMEISGDGENLRIPDGTELASGALDGESMSMTFDLTPMFDELISMVDSDPELASMAGMDLRMEMVMDAETLYLRTPLFADLAALEPGGMPDAMAPLLELSDQWGRIDLGALDGFGPADVAGLTGFDTGSSPDEMLELLDMIDENITVVGTETIRGVETTHVVWMLDSADLLRAEVQPVDTLDLGLTADFAVPVDLYLDGAGNVHRFALQLDFGEMLGEMFAGADDGFGMPAEDDFVFAMSMQMDMWDHNQPVGIVVPEASVDLTAAFGELGSLAH